MTTSKFYSFNVEKRNCILEDIADTALDKWSSDPIRNNMTFYSTLTEVLHELGLAHLRSRYKIPVDFEVDPRVEWDEFLV